MRSWAGVVWPCWTTPALCSPVPGDKSQGVRAAWPEPKCPPRGKWLSQERCFHATKQRKPTATRRQEDPPTPARAHTDALDPVTQHGSPQNVTLGQGAGGKPRA